MKAVEWGTVPAWVSAIISLLALSSAVLATRRAWQVLGIQRAAERRTEDELRKRLNEERRAQAARVTAWISTVHDSGTATTIVEIRNASELPVYELMAMVRLNGQVVETLDVGVLPPSVETMRRPLTSQGRSGGAWNVELTFRDSAGFSWHRGEKGALAETEDVADP